MKKGFTLIELLAVIVILSVILVIAVPQVLKVIDSAKEGAFESDAKLVVDAIQKERLTDEEFDYTTVDENTVHTVLGLSNDNYQSVEVTEEDGVAHLVVVGKNKWDGLTAYGTFDDMRVANSYEYNASDPVIILLGSNPVTIFQGTTYTDAGATATDNNNNNITGDIVRVSNVDTSVIGTYVVTYNVTDSHGRASIPVLRTVNVIEGDYLASKGVNKPKLVTGMTAVKWNSTTSTWDAISNPDTDTSWYDYPNKQWANAETTDGSFWVWIPRYIYKITSGWHSNTTGAINIQFTKDTNDNWNSSAIGNINIGTVSTSSNNTWTNEPAFTFGTTELAGFWVEKFEVSAPASSSCYTSSSSTNCDVSNLLPLSKPNLRSWRYISVNNAFTTARNMETSNTYGWGTSGNGIDTHMMKNIEWGAVAYLSKSIYGQNANEVWINNSSTNTTGCSGDNLVPIYAGCQYAYNTTNGAKASTTGTIYGVYDMNGGSREYTAAHINNSYVDDYGLSLYNANVKYKDIYAVGGTDDAQTNYAIASISQKGDAVYETSSSYVAYSAWFGDYTYMPQFDSLWFIRGGSFNDGGGCAAGLFAFDRGYGGAIVDISFRPVLAVASGL